MKKFLLFIFVLLFIACDKSGLGPHGKESQANGNNPGAEVLIKTADFVRLKVNKVDEDRVIALEKPYTELVDGTAYFKAEIMNFSTDWQFLEIRFEHRLNYNPNDPWNAKSLNYGESINYNGFNLDVDPNMVPRFFVYIDGYLPDGPHGVPEKHFSRLPTDFQNLVIDGTGDAIETKIPIPINLKSFVSDELVQITNKHEIETFDYSKELEFKLLNLIKTRDAKFFINITYWIPETFTVDSKRGLTLTVSMTFTSEEIVDKISIEVEELKIMKEKLMQKMVELKDFYHPNTAPIIAEDMEYEIYIESFTDTELETKISDQQGTKYPIIFRKVKKAVLDLKQFNLVDLN